MSECIATTVLGLHPSQRTMADVTNTCIPSPSDHKTARNAIVNVIGAAEGIIDADSGAAEAFTRAATRVRLGQSGTLVIHVKSAQNLPATDGVFAAVRVATAVGVRKRYRTATRYSTDPDFDQFLPIDGKLGDLISEPALLELYEEREAAEDGKQRYRKLGSIELPIEGLTRKTKLEWDNAMMETSVRSPPAQAQRGATLSVHVSFDIEAVQFAFPTPIAATAALAFDQPPPDDATRLELFRDSVINYILKHKIFVVLTVSPCPRAPSRVPAHSEISCVAEVIRSPCRDLAALTHRGTDGTRSLTVGLIEHAHSPCD